MSHRICILDSNIDYNYNVITHDYDVRLRWIECHLNSNILPFVMWSKHNNMVGVGPGVGADVIRQRRKRADKLKKEQQVVVIHWYK